MFTIYLIESLTTLCAVFFIAIGAIIIGLIGFLTENYEDYEAAKNNIKREKNNIARLKEAKGNNWETRVKDGEDNLKSLENDCKKFKKIIKKFIISASILLILFIVTPSTRTAYRIWGIGSVVEYVKANPTAQKIPDKVINKLDKWLDKEELNEDKEETK